MVRKIILLLAFLLTASCAALRKVPLENRVEVKRDSIYIDRVKVDSVTTKEFVYIREKGDTVTIFRDRWRDRLRESHDTLYIEKTDTLRIDRPVIIEVEKPWKWYNRGALWLGRLCLIALILWALFLYIKQKH